MFAFSFTSSTLHELGSWELTLALIAAMLVVAEIGFRIGRSRHHRIDDVARGHFTAVQASLLGLLALLLGFTFNMATVRFDARRQGVIDTANNLTSIGLRSLELPEPSRQEFRQRLREFLAMQADPKVLKPGVTAAELSARAGKAEQLHRQMWEILEQESLKPNPPRVIETLFGQLTESHSLLIRRIYAYMNRVPDEILILLFAAAIGAACVVGFSAGLGRNRGRFQIIALSVFVCGTIHVILQLDRPLNGLQVDQSPLLHLRNQWEQEASR